MISCLGICLLLAIHSASTWRESWLAVKNASGSSWLVTRYDDMTSTMAGLSSFRLRQTPRPPATPMRLV
ncbi:MAG: hypothetical protein ACTHLK_11295 [Brucella intermedia]